MPLKYTLWWYLKQFGAAEKILKTMSFKHAFWQCDLQLPKTGVENGSLNDLELQRRKKIKKISLKHASWRYLKRFGTAENILKTMTVNGAFWRLPIFKTIWNCRFFFENNVSKACVVTVLETIWNCRNKWKQYLWSMHPDGIWNDLEHPSCHVVFLFPRIRSILNLTFCQSNPVLTHITFFIA